MNQKFANSRKTRNSQLLDPTVLISSVASTWEITLCGKVFYYLHFSECLVARPTLRSPRHEKEPTPTWFFIFQENLSTSYHFTYCLDKSLPALNSCTFVSNQLQTFCVLFIVLLLLTSKSPQLDTHGTQNLLITDGIC